jgi:hypothetical protein
MKPLPDLTDDELASLARRALQDLPDAPGPWLARARGLWSSVHPTPASVATSLATSTLRRWIAALSFDSWAQPAQALGMRAVAAEGRHLLYSTERFDVDLRITPMGARFEVRGQVLGPDGVTGRALWQPEAGSPAREATLDEMSEFCIADLPPGRGQLTLSLAGDEIVLPALELGPPRA